jgi:hypothetical protein
MIRVGNASDPTRGYARRSSGRSRKASANGCSRNVDLPASLL